MNERIGQLMTEAGDYARGLTAMRPAAYEAVFIAKYTDLLLAECISQVDVAFATKISRHFGIIEP